MKRENFSKPGFIRPGIDEGARNAPVPQRLLDQEDVAGPPVQVSCEGVAKTMNRCGACDACFYKPLGEAALHVPVG